jgi:lysophospholipase L1-like esterase
MYRSKSLRWLDKHPTILSVAVFLVFFVVGDLILGHLTIVRSERIFHPYFHHSFARNTTFHEVWGGEDYVIRTNSLGFKDEKIRSVPADVEAGKTRVVVLGDSFAEGIGLPYERTFPGLVQQQLGTARFEVLNAGVAGYSPRTYYLKMQYLLEQSGLRLHHLVVFIDISDLRDEIMYKGFQPAKRSPPGRDADFFLKNHSFSYARIRPRLRGWYESARVIWTYALPGRRASPGPPSDGDHVLNVDEFLDGRESERSRWTFDDAVFDKWGKMGAGLAVSNMDQLVDLCKRHGITVTIAVYPWPDQILHHDLDSRQVSIWRAFAEAHGTGFIDYFPDFIGDRNAIATVKEFFIPGDAHWSAAGHRLIAQRLAAEIRDDDLAERNLRGHEGQSQ